jgi:hypothetical protein
VAANIKLQKHKEHKLLRSIRGSGCNHFTLIYDTYSPALFGCILNRIHDKNVASIVLQQVFVEAWRRCIKEDCAYKSLFARLYAISVELSDKYYAGTNRPGAEAVGQLAATGD